MHIKLDRVQTEVFLYKTLIYHWRQKISCSSAFPCSLLDPLRGIDGEGRVSSDGISKIERGYFPEKKSLLCMKYLLQN